MQIDERAVLDFLKTNLNVDTTGLDADSALVSSGLVDSLGLVDLVMFLETDAGLRVAPGEISLEHFDTAGRIVRFLAHKRAAAGGT